MKTLLSLLLLGSFFPTLLNAQNSYVKVDCNNFELNSLTFKPLVCNYLIDFSKDYNLNTYYLSPNWNYSDLHGVPNTGGPARYCYSLSDDKGISLKKVGKDLQKIQSLGFNTVRVFIAPKIENNLLIVPTGSYSSYFALVDQFLDSASIYNMKVILTVGQKGEWKVQESYTSYLEIAAEHFKNRTAILAYDLNNEPFYEFSHTNKNNKYQVSNYVSEWCYAIKKHDPNHLITIGLTLPETTIAWDPLVMPIDFVSFHFYAWTDNLQNSKNNMSAYLHWASKTIDIPWIIGETGYSGTNTNISDPNYQVGTESQQSSFATFTLQRSIDCSCKGYSWWQYQEINWDAPWENHLGLINNYGISNGFLAETSKIAALSFSNYVNLTSNSNNCTKPSNYYNIYNYTTTELTGRVVDNNGLGIENAVIVGWKQVGSEYPYYTTYSNANGYFTLKSNTPGFSLFALWISLPGYSTVQVNNPISGLTYSIKPINKNRWTKKWTNDANNLIDNWSINDSDKFYYGDFNGDGSDEILCVKSTNGNNDLISMLHYNHLTADWDIGWSNLGNPQAADSLYYYRKKLVVGDFNGDGKDDLFGVDNSGNNLATFHFGADGLWHKWQTNNGYVNNQQYPMSFLQPYSEYFVSGDFDGDGRDDLFGSDLPTGWTTWFKFGSNNQWVWQQTDHGETNNINYPMSYMRPYRDNFIVGDFDGNGQDDILGNDLPDGYMTLFKFENNEWKCNLP